MSQVSFPYPVLGSGDDYSEADFQVAFKWPECELDSEASILEIPFKFSMNDEAIQDLLATRRASYGFEVSCSATSRREVFMARETAGNLSLDTTQLFGTVRIAPKIFVLEEVNEFHSPNFNPEFEDSRFSLSPGDFVASAAEEVISVDLKKLKLESLLRVERVDGLDPWTYKFSFEGEHLVMMLSGKFHDFFLEARDNPSTRPFLIMSVYKDCLVAALEALIDDDGETSSSWSRALADKLEKNRLQLPDSKNFDQLNEIAQKLLLDLGVKKAASK
ncbi:hypothetical protein N9E47_07915 [Luminiphilus sp.]|nr:hypothetical protein [Luminiphilus sp.]MDB0009104.1 hypothetical protein [Luminiphilus sp.]